MADQPDAAGITRNGLRVDLAKQQAWQRRGAEAYAARRRARKNAARLTSRIDRPQKGWSTTVRKMAAARSGGRCERCLYGVAVHLHHRKSRRFGDHRIVNALHVCAICHDAIHTMSPDVAYDAGWLVRSTADPAAIPVSLPAIGLRLPSDDGTWQAAA